MAWIVMSVWALLIVPGSIAALREGRYLAFAVLLGIVVVPVTNWLDLDVAGGVERLHVDALDVDPRVVLRLIEYYRDHPEARTELGTDAALRHGASTQTTPPARV